MSTNSVTDIAARLILDSSELNQGLKLVEQKFVDFSKSIASPFYSGSAVDEGYAHVEAYKAREKAAELQLIQETIAARNREEMLMASLRREQQMRIENIKQTNERSAALQAAERERFAKQFSASLKADMEARYANDVKQYWINSYNDIAKARREIAAQEIADAKNQAEMLAKLRFDWIEPRTQEGQDFSNNLRTQMEAESLAEREKQREIYRQRAIERDDKAYEENKARQEQAFRDNQKILQNQAAVDERAAKEAAQRVKEINAPQQDAHVIAYRAKQEREAQDVKERSLRLIRSLATAQDLHNERVQEYTNFLRLNLLTQDQFNEAVAQSERVMHSSDKGSGAYTGMLAQASFAAEDFMQGIAMGDIRSALLGASNNLTMVARGALDATEGMTVLGMGMQSVLTIAIAIPATVVGAIAAFSYLNRAEVDARSLADALRDVERGYDGVQQAMDFRHQASRSKEQIADIESISQAQKEYNETLRRQQEAEEKLTAARARQTRTGSETLINTLGGQEAYNEMQNIINSLIRSGHEGSVQLGKDMAASMSAAMSAAQAGEAEKMIDALRSLNELSNSMVFQNAKPGSILERINMLINDPTAQDKLEAIFNTGYLGYTEDRTKLNELRDSMAQVANDMAQAENEMKQATADRERLEQRMAELRKEGLRLSEEEFKEKQRIAEQERQQFAGQIAAEAALLEEKRRSELFDMSATEHQKEMLAIQKQMQEFMGPSAVMPFIPQIVTTPETSLMHVGVNNLVMDAMTQLMQQNAQAAGMEFLQGQAAMLENEIANLQKASSPEIIGGMQQNAFDAQAEAFKQIFAAANKQPNPQLTALGQKLDAIKTAIQNGGVLQIVQ